MFVYTNIKAPDAYRVYTRAAIELARNNRVSTRVPRLQFISVMLSPSLKPALLYPLWLSLNRDVVQRFWEVLDYYESYPVDTMIISPLR